MDVILLYKFMDVKRTLFTIRTIIIYPSYYLFTARICIMDNRDIIINHNECNHNKTMFSSEPDKSAGDLAL